MKEIILRNKSMPLSGQSIILKSVPKQAILATKPIITPTITNAGFCFSAFSVSFFFLNLIFNI